MNQATTGRASSTNTSAKQALQLQVACHYILHCHCKIVLT